MILQLFPEFGGTHLPLKGKVTAVHGDAGSVGIKSGARHYSVDIKPLYPDGTDDKTRPALKDVPLDVPWSGDGRGVFGLPKVGAIVRVCFYGGSAAHPYIDGVLPDGSSVPAVEQGQYLIQLNDQMTVLLEPSGYTIKVKDANAKVNIEAAGDVNVKADMNVKVEAALSAEVKAGTTATVNAGVKASIKAPLVDIGAAAGPSIAYQGALVATPLGPGSVLLGSLTCKVTP